MTQMHHGTNVLHVRQTNHLTKQRETNEATKYKLYLARRPFPEVYNMSPLGRTTCMQQKSSM